MSSVLTAAENFTVVVYKRGSTVNGAQSGTLTSITVRNGALRWASGNKGMVGTSPTRYFTVNGTPANDTTIPINSVSLSILDGERLVNLGTDTGGGTPNFDGSGVSIYSVNSDSATAISQSRVTTDGHGEYAYYLATALSAVDEVVLSGTTPVELIEDVPAGSPHRIASPEVDGASAVAHILDTEKAYTTSGAKLVSFRNATTEKSSIDKDGTFVGPVSASTLSASGAASLTTLSVSGVSTLTGAVTAATTLAVTGATTLTGALAANGGLTTTTCTSSAVTTGSIVNSGPTDIVGAVTQTNTGSINSFAGAVRLGANAGGFGGFANVQSQTEELTLAGSSTDSVGNLLPANSLILAVVARVTSTISGGGVAGWTLEDTATATRFAAATAALTAGTTVIGVRQWLGGVSSDAAGPLQVAAAKVRVDYAGSPTAGRVRVTVFYIDFNPPTS